MSTSRKGHGVWAAKAAAQERVGAIIAVLACLAVAAIYIAVIEWRGSDPIVEETLISVEVVRTETHYRGKQGFASYALLAKLPDGSQIWAKDLPRQIRKPGSTIELRQIRYRSGRIGYAVPGAL